MLNISWHVLSVGRRTWIRFIHIYVKFETKFSWHSYFKFELLFFSLYLVRGQLNERFWDILHQNCIKRESFCLLMDYQKINSKMLCLKLYPCTLAMDNFKSMPNLWVIFILFFIFQKGKHFIFKYLFLFFKVLEWNM